MMFATFAAVVVVTVQLSWIQQPTTIEEGTNIYREIAGTFQQVGQVGPNETTFTETFSASEGAELPYIIRAFRGNELGSPSNEWVGVVPTEPAPEPEPEPCKQKGKSKNCR
jgi:hypothetical protein